MSREEQMQLVLDIPADALQDFILEGRVLSTDDDYTVIEIARDGFKHITDEDRFVTLMPVDVPSLLRAIVEARDSQGDTASFHPQPLRDVQI
jgi:hypothetical protein